MDGWDVQARKIGQLSVLSFFLWFVLLLSAATVIHTNETISTVFPSEFNRMLFLGGGFLFASLLSLTLAFIWRYRKLCNTLRRESRSQCLRVSVFAHHWRRVESVRFLVDAFGFCSRLRQAATFGPDIFSCLL